MTIVNPDEWDGKTSSKMMGAANKQAVYVFMDGGVLHSLKDLYNAESFDFVFDLMTYNSSTSLKRFKTSNKSSSATRRSSRKAEDTMMLPSTGEALEKARTSSQIILHATERAEGMYT